MSQGLSRRTVLKGLGAAISLPLLEAMSRPLAYATIDRPPVSPNRMAFLYVPNGMHMQDWTPAAEGADFTLPHILEPLAEHRKDILVLSGLTQDKARPNGDGPGDHARSAASFLTGVQARKTHGADLRAGTSVDQVAAAKMGGLTRFSSLELGVDHGTQAGNCDSGYSCAYSSNISWRNEATPVAKEINPRLVFERLFADASPQDQEKVVRRQKFNRSILDLVRNDAWRLERSLGAADRRKLDEYLSSIRELEQRITYSEKVKLEAHPTFDAPQGIPETYQDHIRIMCDLMVLAFQTDSTRVTTFLVDNEQSGRSYPQIGVRRGHHELSHHGGDPEKHEDIKKINRFHTEQFAYLLKRMSETPEGDGRLIDHVMLVYGSGISDGDLHNHDNLPILLAGHGCGTIQPGRHVKYPEDTPLNNLYLSMLDFIEADTERLGDSTGKLAGLTV